MRRFVSLVAILFFTVPFGLSVIGCGKKTVDTVYCNAGDSGPATGQVASISLAPNYATTGESLSYGQIGSYLSASALDCKGNPVGGARYTYASTNMAVADINPSTGQVCAGTWNRNTGGGVADFTTCTAFTTPPSTYIAYVTAAALGAVSNAIPVYIHPIVTGIVLGSPSTNCTTDPATNCCPANTSTVYTPTPLTYNPNSCYSQGTTTQLIARVYQNGTTNAADNITCQVGHLTFTPQTASNIVSIDENGVATANQPGSTLVTGAVASSSSGTSSGFFSTCPPASITLSVPGQPAGTSAIKVALNNPQPLTATVLDKNGVTLTGLSLEYESTSPQTIPASTSTITPTFPGTATVTALCMPSTCNPSPFSQTGFLDNGTPIASNGITITAAGTSSTVIYMGSTSSQYIMPMDFSTNLQSSLIKLPYVPNSMVISQDGSTIYLGSTQGLMTVNTASNTVSAANITLPGTVLSVSPDGSTVVLTDPTRQTITLYSVSGTVIKTVTGGVGTTAVWTPDSNTVYVTTQTSALLTYSNFTNWQTTTTSLPYTSSVVTVPSVGAYFGTGTPGISSGSTDGRSFCPSGVTSAGSPVSVTNTFAPLASSSSAITDVLAATTDGKHILGAHAGTSSWTLSDLHTTLPVTTACPLSSSNTSTVTNTYFPTTVNTLTNAPTGTPSVSPTSITGVLPAGNSALAFITYNGTGGYLPEYVPATTGAGALTYVQLTGTATAPISGVWSTDNNTFYTGTATDNSVHEITFSTTLNKWVDSGTLTPALPNASGTGTAPVTIIVQKPKRVTTS